jgi:hypothetical protein
MGPSPTSLSSAPPRQLRRGGNRAWTVLAASSRARASLPPVSPSASRRALAGRSPAIARPYARPRHHVCETGAGWVEEGLRRRHCSSSWRRRARALPARAGGACLFWIRAIKGRIEKGYKCFRSCAGAADAGGRTFLMGYLTDFTSKISDTWCPHPAPSSSNFFCHSGAASRHRRGLPAVHRHRENDDRALDDFLDAGREPHDQKAEAKNANEDGADH